ncbi:hypothetical protein ACE193_14345 [Bernardetia sp. OM2101]|uniref:hypothetical protein n=1 Tax=Bernardetia sp. OM2101 TaxID=3344876 RepID=UPI0035CF3988
MKNTILQKAVIVLHIGICVFLLLGLVEEFEKGKKVILNFDLFSPYFYKNLVYCIAFLLGILYILDSIKKGLSNKELSILFSLFLFIFATLFSYIQINRISCTMSSEVNERTISEWIMMISFPILFLLLSFSSLIYPINKLEKELYLDSELIQNNIPNYYFWRIHHILSILLCIIAFGTCIYINYSYDASWIPYSISTFLFINSILLWFLPKWGSISFSILCMIVICGIYYLFISKPPKAIILICIPLFMTLSFGSIPFILLNKDARREWEMK